MGLPCHFQALFSPPALPPALKDIFEDDCRLESESPPCVSVALAPLDGKDSRARIYIRCPTQYPDEKPQVGANVAAAAKGKGRSHGRSFNVLPGRR